MRAAADSARAAVSAHLARERIEHADELQRVRGSCTDQLTAMGAETATAQAELEAARRGVAAQLEATRLEAKAELRGALEQVAQQQAASHAQAQERDAEAKAEALQREQARLLASQATELRLGGELDRALAELRGWQAGGKDTEHGLLAEVGRWKAMVEEERSRHAAERARDGERAAVALEQERAAAAEQGEAQREQMRAMQAAMQSEMEWRASELERATKQGAVEREAHLAQLGIETRSAAEVRE